MMAEHPADSPPQAPLVPEGGRFRGRVHLRGAQEILGEITGPVEATGSLVIGPNARVDGPVVADILDLEGRVEGDVVARERVSLLAGATLRGTLRSPRVSVAEGAHLEGPCRIGPLDGKADDSKSP